MKKSIFHFFLFDPHSRLFLLVFLICISLFSFLGCYFADVQAQPSPSPTAPWGSLNLSPQQSAEINRLEDRWERTYSELSPQIEQDKTQLRQMLNAPQSSDRQIIDLQNRIQVNEQRLRNEATRIFLNKKEQLSPAQKVRLQEIMNH